MILINKMNFKLMKWNRKGVKKPSEKITKLIFGLLIFFSLAYVIFNFFSDDFDIDSAIEICKSSVDAREFVHRNTKTARGTLPLLCKTIPLEIPEEKYNALANENFKKAVMMNIADRSMDCWYMFGKGKYDRNVFGSWNVFQANRCFACFNFTIRDHKNYEPIYLDKFSQFISEEPYKPIPRHVPFCLFDDEEQEGCVSEGSPECIRKGGNCLDSRTEDFSGFKKYDGWDCDSNKKSCFVHESMIETYANYMQSEAFGVFTADPGMLSLPELEEGQTFNIDQVPGFVKDETYGIGFIVHTRDVGYSVVAGSLSVFGAALTVMTGGSFGLIVLGVVATTGTGVASDAVMNNLRRQPPTIYLAKMEGIEQRCALVKDFNMK